MPRRSDKPRQAPGRVDTPPFFSNTAPDDLDIGGIDVGDDEHCLDHLPNTLHITHSASIELKHGSSDHLPAGLYPHPIAISTCSTNQRRPTPRSPTRPVGLAILCQIQAHPPLGLALHAKVSGRAHQVPVDQDAGVADVKWRGGKRQKQVQSQASHQPLPRAFDELPAPRVEHLTQGLAGTNRDPD